jgi:hypothetical protein
MWLSGSHDLNLVRRVREQNTDIDNILAQLAGQHIPEPFLATNVIQAVDTDPDNATGKASAW